MFKLLVIALVAAALQLASAQSIGMSHPTVPVGLAMAMPSLRNPLALTVGINPSAPLTSILSTPMAQGLGSPVLQLLNQEANAAKHAIAVQMIVSGMDSIDALAVGEIPAPGQGHFHCRLDSNPVSASAAPRIDYHQVPSGIHQVACWTVNNAHQPMSEVLSHTVVIP